MDDVETKARAGHRQQGVAVLAITVILLLITVIGTLAASQAVMLEQKISGTDVRGKEVYAAAIGGLEYGVDWFEANYADLTWTDADGDGVACAGDTATPDAMAKKELTADHYGHRITYTLGNCLNESPVFVTVSSLAVAENDSHVRKSVAVDIMLGRTELFSRDVQGGTPEVFAGPPILVEECTDGNTGNPRLVVYDDGDPDTPVPVAIGTTRGDPDCLNEGHINQYQCGVDGCGKQIKKETEITPPVKSALNESRSLWDTVFGPGVDIGTLQKLEESHPDTVMVIDSDDELGAYGKTLGSSDEPVILFFSADVCPKLNGGYVIHGLVYLATTDPDCMLNGWGNTEIHGTLAKAGNLTKMTANTEIYDTDLDFGGGVEPGDTQLVESPVLIDRFAEIPGSWRDF